MGKGGGGEGRVEEERARGEEGEGGKFGAGPRPGAVRTICDFNYRHSFFFSFSFVHSTCISAFEDSPPASRSKVERSRLVLLLDWHFLFHFVLALHQLLVLVNRRSFVLLVFGDEVRKIALCLGEL